MEPTHDELLQKNKLVRVHHRNLQFLAIETFNVKDDLAPNIMKAVFRFGPVGIYLHKVNNRSTTARREICSELTIETPELRQWRHYGIFIVNFKHISHLVLRF